MREHGGWPGRIVVPAAQRLRAVAVAAGAIAVAACGWALLVSPAAQPAPLYTALAAGGAEPAPNAPAGGGLLTGVVTGGLVNGLVAGTNGLVTGLAASTGGGGGSSVAGLSLTASAGGGTVAGVNVTTGGGSSGTVAGVQITTGGTSGGTSLGVQVTTSGAAGSTVAGLSVTTGASLSNTGVTVNATTGGNNGGSVAGVQLTAGSAAGGTVAGVQITTGNPAGGAVAGVQLTTGVAAGPAGTAIVPIGQGGGDQGSGHQQGGNSIVRNGQQQGGGNGGGAEAQAQPSPPVASHPVAQPAPVRPANQIVPVAPSEPAQQPPVPSESAPQPPAPETPQIVVSPPAPSTTLPQRQPAPPSAAPPAVFLNVVPPAPVATPLAAAPAEEEPSPTATSAPPVDTTTPNGALTNGGVMFVSPASSAASPSAMATPSATVEATVSPATPAPTATPANIRPPRATAPEPRDEGGSILGMPVPRAVQDAALAAEPYFGFALGVLIVVLVAGVRALVERRRDARALATAAAMGGGPRPGREALVIVEGLRRQLEFSQAIAENLGEGIVVVDRAGRVTFANPTAAALLGQKSETLRGTALAQAVGAGGDALAALLAGTMKQEAPLRLDDLRVALPSGEERALAVAAAPLLRDQRVVGVVLALHDATAERARIVALEQRALHDVLTGLPNRTLFEDRLERALALALREGTKVAVLFIDLDGFKTVNDTFGHQAGDALLREVARRLEGRLRRSDTVARLGGDEFALVLPRADVAGARVVAGEIAAALAGSIDALGYQVRVGASIGIAVAPDHGLDVATLIRCADLAMYQAKRGRLGIAVYQRELLVG